MSSKYKGLPDIDTAPDVFETPDEPETSLRPQEDGIDDDLPPKRSDGREGLDTADLPDRKKAQKVFNKRSTYTFRPQLPSLSHLDNNSDSDNEISILPKENPASRLRRIKAELLEVEKEMASTSTSTSSSSISRLPSITGQTRAPLNGKRKSVIPQREAVDLVAELARLRERLEGVELGGEGGGSEGGGVEWKRRLERLRVGQDGTADDGAVEEEVEQAGESSGSAAMGGYKLSELDKRLAYLENLVGPSGEGLDQNTTSPLLPTITKLDHLLALLTQPRHLDIISRRIKLLLVDLDRASTTSRRNPAQTPQPTTSSTSASTTTLSSTDQTNLQTLFSLLPRLDPLLPILPPLLTRLRSLSTLHTEAGEVAEGLRRLQTDDRRFKNEISDLGGVVDSVKKGLEEAAIGVERNWVGLEERLKALEGRLGDLAK